MSPAGIMVAAVLSSMALVLPAWAGADTDCCNAIEELQRQILLLQAQIDELKAQQEAQDGDGSDIQVKWQGAPEISSADGDFKFKVRGRLYADYGTMDGHTFGDPSPDPYNHGTELRTARLGVEGQIFGHTKYRFEADFAGGTDDVEVKDAYLQWDLSPASLTIGQFKTPNSLEEQTSSRFTSFMERAAFTDSFGLARQVGIGVGFKGDNWTLKAGGFGENLHAETDFEEGWTVAARGTFAPIAVGNKAVHLGASVRWRWRSEDDPSTDYGVRPLIHMASEKFVGLKGLPVDQDLFWGVEAAGVWGPVSIQGEYAMLNVDFEHSTGGLGAFLPGQNFDRTDPDFAGWYIGGSVFLTGESRTYKADKGAFDRIEVKSPVNDGGMGAWQLALRYDSLDLNDDGVNLGEQDALVVGINWYFNNYTRLMVNYIRANVTAPSELTLMLPTGESAIIGGTPTDNDIESVGVRAQIDW
ncbi:MAG: hypothetical protein E2O89_01155 [Alphaproteobacteria bacterium]|nr:MAG: hypothetical protein E2O89_01155 [Alphaproteobacteria bacterium]